VANPFPPLSLWIIADRQNNNKTEKNPTKGERFDLRSPYADGAYVDDDEETAWDSIRNFGKKALNFRGRAGAEEINSKYGKPIKWVNRTPPKQ